MKITVVVDDRDDAEEFGCEYAFSKDVHDLQGLLYFYGQVARGIGFTSTDRFGCVQDDNSEVWSEF